MDYLPNLFEVIIIIAVLSFAIVMIVSAIKDAVTPKSSTSATRLPGVVVTTSTVQKVTEEDDVSYEFVLVTLIMFNQAPVYFMCFVVDEIESEHLRTIVTNTLKSENKVLHVDNTDETFHEETILGLIENEDTFTNVVPYLDQNRDYDGGRMDWIITIICGSNAANSAAAEAVNEHYQY